MNLTYEMREENHLQPCGHLQSCALVATLQPDFPKSLELLKQKFCTANAQLCAFFHTGGVNEKESLIYQNIAWVKTIIEAEIAGMTKTPVT